MTLPFENDTRRIIHGLAKADLKTHKLKTFLTATIIVLATCLMATIFSVLVMMRWIKRIRLHTMLCIGQ